jgi:hypothetical protein
VGRTEILARAIHEDYVRKQLEAGHTPAENPSIVAWEDLPDDLRESNRHQAEDIAAKLRAIGCEIGPSSDGQDGAERIEENLERLARMEHDRWWHERKTAGWTYGPTKDVAGKKSPYLVPFDELPKEIRELDRNAVRAIPEVLARAGLGVVLLEEERQDG